MAYSPTWRAYEGRQPPPLRRLDRGEPRYHSDWRERPEGAWYNPIAAENAVAFFSRYCALTTDAHAGRPFVLEPWQADWIIRPAFGWHRADGTRLYRRVLIWVPRKNGKTELMAGVSHLLLLGDDVEGAEAYVIAATRDQARKVFDAAKAMLNFSPELMESYDAFESSLYYRSRRSILKPLTGKPHGKHGLRTTYLIGDEVHEWPSDLLYTYVRQAMSSRAEPMEWLISTSGVENGYGIALWEQTIGICEGGYDDPETLAVVWCAPQDPRAEFDIDDPIIWDEANPNLGVSKSYDYMVRQARAARQSTVDDARFRQYDLNIWVSANDRWLSMTDWSACTTSPDGWRTAAERLKGRRCWGGLDIAATQDINALVYLFEPLAPGGRWDLLARFWWPSKALQAAAAKSRIPFLSWVREGAMIEVPGNAADHDLIREQVLQDAEDYDLQGLAIDAFSAHNIIQPLTAAGLPVTPVRWGMVSMAAPSKWFEMRVLRHELDHGANPVLRWMAQGCQIRRDRSDNYMPIKPQGSPGHTKIDGIAASVMAAALAGQPAQPQKSYLESAPLLIL